MDTIKVTPFKGQTAYSQIGGVPVELSLLDNKGEQVILPVMCKDYLQDVFFSEKMKQPINVHGLQYNPGKLDVGQDTFDLCLDFKTVKRQTYKVVDGKSKMIFEEIKEDPRGAENALRLVNKFEERLHFRRSELLQGSDSQRILRFSQAWTKAPIRVSTYATLVRVGLKYTDIDPVQFLTEFAAGKHGSVAPNDPQYIAQAIKLDRVNKIWNGEWPKQTYEQYTSGKAERDPYGGFESVVYQVHGRQFAYYTEPNAT